MRNRVRLSRTAQNDLADLHEYLSGYSVAAANRVVANLGRVLEYDVAINPILYGWFYLLGCPLRARLFRISRRTQYWIVYEYREDLDLIFVHRIWNASRNPAAFEP
jgi:plasmid stabilization system protein ParE